MVIDIGKLTEKELIDLNRKIVERLKFLESMRVHTEMLEFSVGERVCFSPPGHGDVIGILVKYNKKTVTVLTEDGQSWNVSPRLLSRPKEAKKTVAQPGKVIEIKPK